MYVRTTAFDARVGVIGVMNPFIWKETFVPAAILDVGLVCVVILSVREL